MILKAEVIKVYPASKGNSRYRIWIRKDYLLKRRDQKYGSLIMVSMFNDNINDDIKLGDIIEGDIDISSKPFNDKYYTNVSMSNVEICVKKRSFINEH